MNVVYLIFLALSWVGIECCIGGTRLIFSLPFYTVLAVCALLSTVSMRRRLRTPPDGLCIASTLLLGAWILLRAWRSPVEYLALPDFFMMTACLMVYLLTAFYLTGVGYQMAVAVVLVLIAVVQVLVGVIQFCKDPQFMLFGFMRPSVNRPSGMYVSPNNFAGFLVAVAILLISIGVWSRWKSWAKILALYFGFSCFVGVAVSGSRGGYFDTMGSLLCFAAGSIYAVRILNRRLVVPVTIGSLAGVAIVVAVAAFLMTHSDLLTTRMQTMAVKDVRIYNWAAAIDHIKVSPWIGTGAGTHLIYGRLFRRPQIQADPVHAHCDYLELVAEYGAVGGACMLLFVVAHVRKALRSMSELLRERIYPSGLSMSNSFAVQFGALCAVGGLAIHSVVDFDMHIPANAMIFAFLFGVLAHSGVDREPSFAGRHITPWAKALLPALGVLMLWRGAPLIPSEYCAESSRVALRDHNFISSIQLAKKGLGSAADPAAGDLAPLPPTALDWWLAKLGANPGNPDLYFYMGEANRVLGYLIRSRYLKRVYYVRAAAAFEAGLKVFPQDESMMVRYGQVLDEMRKYAAAEAVYQKAIQWDPNLNVLYDYYGSHLTAEGKKDEAESLARERNARKTEEVDTVPTGDMRLQ